MPFDYGRDVGNLHVIDYYLHLAMRDLAAYGTCVIHTDAISFRTNPPAYLYLYDPDDWSRYDGELL